MPRFLVDAQLPPALARKLNSPAHESTHVLDVGLLDAGDGQIWDYALTHDMAIITKDEDFAIRASVSKISPIIVWVRIGNCPNVKLLAWFERELPSVIAAMQSGNRLVEISG
jgi:predicted nuclease of predicted toxin-antitoxin system